MKMKGVIGTCLCFILCACGLGKLPPPVIPAAEYARRIRQEQSGHATVAAQPIVAAHAIQQTPTERASLRLVAENSSPADDSSIHAPELAPADATGASAAGEPQFDVYRSTMQDKRDYNGALSLGDPGVSASLWKESRGETELFHDHRAWQAMDLITIVVTESAEGKKEADTQVTQESTISAAINNLFGLENDSAFSGPKAIDKTNLINATSTSDFKGEGETTRKGSLKAKISAMVVEVLPSGVLRIEGEKIIAVNNEEQIMIISGIVRTRDVTSENEIDSSKIANMRIDYFGRGTVGDAQYGGWLSNVVRRLWPF